VPAILATWEAEIGRKPNQANSSKLPLLQNNKAKWTGGVIQAVECLLWKCKALSSNINSIRKEKKISLLWSHTAVISGLRGLRHENQEFKASLNYIVRLCLKKKKCLY
jgi:hypothetical protein